MIRYDRDEDNNGKTSLQPPQRPPRLEVNLEKTVSLPTPEERDEVQLPRQDPMGISSGNDGLTDLFVAHLRKSLLHQDSERLRLEQQHVALVDLVGQAFLKRAASFADLCLDQDVEEKGHIKVDLAFRRQGSYIEGWLYVRHMGANSRQTGFKVRAQGALPLAMFKKLDDDPSQKVYLDQVMQKVHDVLDMCFSHHCNIVPLRACFELWMNPLEQSVGIEVRQALEQCKSLRKLGDAEGEMVEDTEGGSEEKPETDGETMHTYDGTDLTEATDKEYFGPDRSWDIEDGLRFLSGKQTNPFETKDPSTDKETTSLEILPMDTPSHSLLCLPTLLELLCDLSVHGSLWKAVLCICLGYCIYVLTTKDA